METIAIIESDVSLPDGSGVELCYYAAETAEVPALFLTAVIKKIKKCKKILDEDEFECYTCKATCQ